MKMLFPAHHSVIFFSLACLFWLVICYGSWAKSLPGTGSEEYICNLAGKWCSMKMNLLYGVCWAQAKTIYVALLGSSKCICSLTGMFILSQLWVTVTAFQPSSGYYMGYWEIRCESSQLVYWSCEMPRRQCQFLVCLGIQGRAWEYL